MHSTFLDGGTCSLGFEVSTERPVYIHIAVHRGSTGRVWGSCRVGGPICEDPLPGSVLRGKEGASFIVLSRRRLAAASSKFDFPLSANLLSDVVTYNLRFELSPRYKRVNTTAECYRLSIKLLSRFCIATRPIFNITPEEPGEVSNMPPRDLPRPWDSPRPTSRNIPRPESAGKTTQLIGL